MPRDYNVHRIVKDILAEVSRVVVGKDDTKELLMLALLTEGHVLIEGLPGTAKTTVSRTFATAIGGTFKRVQGTPDMLPADILGFYLYRSDGTSNFMPGPIFANVVLFDELNRTTPRTQAALLEAMQERQVTIERVTHPLERPFLVIANQVPYGGPGTAPLSDVQIDRFMFRVWSGMPDIVEETRVLKDIDLISGAVVRPMATTAEILQLQQDIHKVFVADDIRRYIIDILEGLRRGSDVAFGPSPAAGIALVRGARASAFLEGRDFVVPDDVKRLLLPALSHRLKITAEAGMDGATPESVIQRITDETAVPRQGVATASPAETETAAVIPSPSEVASEPPPVDASAQADKPVVEVEKVSSAGILPDWGLLLLIIALVLAVVILTFGLMSLR